MIPLMSLVRQKIQHVQFILATSQKIVLNKTNTL